MKKTEDMRALVLCDDPDPPEALTRDGLLGLGYSYQRVLRNCLAWCKGASS